jgi:CHAT domain-containing protein
LLSVGLEAKQDSLPVPPVELIVGQTQSASQRSDGPVSYRFEARAGAIYLIQVTQSGLDFIVTLERPDGRIFTYNSPLERDENEYLLVEVTHPGRYRVTVHSEEPTDARGSHSIRLSNVTDARDAEREAWRLVSEGAAANAMDSLKSKLPAVPAYERAARLWRELGNARLEVQALYSIAMLEYEVQYDRAAAARLAAVVSERYRDLDEPALQARSIFLEARSLLEVAGELQGDSSEAAFAKVLRLFDDSLAIQESLGNAYDGAHTVNYLGLTHFRLGNLQEARHYWDQAAPMFASIGEWREELNVRQNLAVIELDQGNYSEAIDTFESILEDLPADADWELRGVVLENLATTYRELGNFDDSLSGLSDALEIYRRVDYRIGVAHALRGIGTTYYSSGEFELAQQFLEQALRIAEEIDDGRLQAFILTSLGSIAYVNKDFEAALDFHKSALPLTNSRPDRAYRQVLIARNLTALGRSDDAIARAEEARQTSTAVGQRVTLADALYELGRAHLASEDPERAAQYLAQSREVYESIGLELGQAKAMNGQAKAARLLGDLDRAIELSAASLIRTEGLRQRVAAPKLRAFWAASRRNFYETHIDLLMARHSANTTGDEYLRRAFATSERSRARLTMDLLGEAATNLRYGAIPELDEKRRQLFEKLAALRSQRDRILSGDPSEGGHGPSLDQILTEMTIIENELNVLETELREDSPVYAGLVSPQALEIQEIQALLEQETVLLHYALGAERSFVWVVTRDSVVAFELAPREVIESIARRAYESLKTYPNDAAARVRLDENLTDLAERILSPIPDLRARKRILVAVDGALQYIPFAVLPVNEGREKRLLVETHEVVAVPSVSVVAALRSRESRTEPDKTLVVFADPVFETTDPRLAAGVITNSSARAMPTDLMTRSSVGARLTRLAATQQEASAISALVPADMRHVASGFAASRDTVLELDLEAFRYVHFATHGLVDSRYPALSALVMSLFDRQGNPQNGYLRLYDIYGLRLNADLVVLSACETGLGREIHGEGLVGIAQGFLYAGARALVVSLWSVPDRATAELMTQFYGHLLDGGMRPADALRSAQRSIAAERRWRDPYFWAGFLLLGDWSESK